MRQYGDRSLVIPAFLAAQVLAASLLCRVAGSAETQQGPRVIEVLADHDSRYKMAGLGKPSITVTAGERVRLRITAIRAKNRNRDGSIHGFSLLRPRDHRPVPGWELLLKPGIQEFDLMAPEEPGDYLVVCTVICSDAHDGMNMPMVVKPQENKSPNSEVEK